jgi:hypothetical protein
LDRADQRRLAGLPPARSSGGRVWSRFAKQVVDQYGGLCHLCDHGGARQADHLVPATERPGRTWKISEFRPAHGAPGNPCPACTELADGPVYCNQLRGMGSVDRARRIIAERTSGGKTPLNPKTPLDVKKPGAPAGDRDAGRVWLPLPAGYPPAVRTRPLRSMN